MLKTILNHKEEDVYMVCYVDCSFRWAGVGDGGKVQDFFISMSPSSHVDNYSGGVWSKKATKFVVIECFCGGLYRGW